MIKKIIGIFFPFRRNFYITELIYIFFKYETPLVIEQLEISSIKTRKFCGVREILISIEDSSEITGDFIVKLEKFLEETLDEEIDIEINVNF